MPRQSNQQYKDPPDTDSIAVGKAFEKVIRRNTNLIPLTSMEDQFAHGDAVSGNGIYHEIKHDPHLSYRKGLMIEVAANRTGDSGWHLSGIFAPSDAWYYWQGESQCYWRFAKSQLAEWAAAKGITPENALDHLNGKKTNELLKEFQGTMLRIRMSYFEADDLGWRVGRYS